MTRSAAALRRVGIIDSHTAGEPTRVVIAGGPDLGRGKLTDRLQALRHKHDWFRSGIVMEPRGSEIIVGALIGEPDDPADLASVIFFNDVGYLGMCGHGTIGLVTTLAYLGRIKPGPHTIQTPVGVVRVQLHNDGSVSVENVPSYRFRQNVSLKVPGFGSFTGDVAWGGNWFFLVADHGYPLQLVNRVELLRVTSAIRSALKSHGVTGADGAVIDHVELFGAPESSENSSRNFVLCPGASFDRSPCGTGTSAKLACLSASGKLKPGEVWRQEGILGTVFSGTFVEQGQRIIPTISGRAWITADTTLLFDPSDPFSEGIDFQMIQEG